MKAQPKRVRIVQSRNRWFVSYADRTRGQRHHAGQFDGRDYTREQVEMWVRSQPNLQLLNPSPAQD